MKKKVAFIGAGMMGAPMARRVLAAGHDVIICDRAQSVLDAFASSGALVTTNASDCSTADIILILVANDKQIMDVVGGPSGILTNLKEGDQPVICVMSTTHPDTVHRIHEQARPFGAAVIDAPISGGIVRAENGTLTIMMAGDETVVKSVEPIMKTMGRNLVYCGKLGSAEAVKVSNNMLCIAIQYLTAETIKLASKYGISFEALAPIMNESTGRSFLTVDADEARRQYYAWASTAEAYAATHNILNKDLHLASRMAKDNDLQLPLLEAISAYVDSEGAAARPRWLEAAGQPQAKA